MATTLLPFSAGHREKTAIDATFRKSDLTDAERSLVAEFVGNHPKRTEDPACCPARRYAKLHLVGRKPRTFLENRRRPRLLPAAPQSR
jgi:hypothetical protein